MEDHHGARRPVGGEALQRGGRAAQRLRDGAVLCVLEVQADVVAALREIDYLKPLDRKHPADYRLVRARDGRRPAAPRAHRHGRRLAAGVVRWALRVYGNIRRDGDCRTVKVLRRQAEVLFTR